MILEGNPDRDAPDAARQRVEEDKLKRIVTVPNFLSLSRIVLVGVYLWLLFGPDAAVLATVVLAVAGTTDFADGYIARRFDQVTTLGKMLDPTADRFLLAGAMSSMIAYGAIPVWLAVVVLSREALVAGTVVVLASMGVARIDVSWIGKAATFGLMVCFPLLLLSHGPGSWTRGVDDAAWVIVVPSLVLSFASAAGYYVPARDGLRALSATNNPDKTAE